jgi:predicted P-loop ATPase
MPSSKTKASAFQAPAKFNFLKERAKQPGVIFYTSGSVNYLKPETGNRCYWPIGCSPNEARRQIEDQKATLKTMITGGAK